MRGVDVFFFRVLRECLFKGAFYSSNIVEVFYPSNIVGGVLSK